MRYTLGFATHSNTVLLVKKTRGPEVNLGKWNGIGGKLEEDEPAHLGMIREAEEETGIQGWWDVFGTFTGPNFHITLFKKELERQIGRERNDVEELLSWWSRDYVFKHPSILAENVGLMVAYALFGVPGDKLTLTRDG